MALALIASCSAFAQSDGSNGEPKHEISLGYGLPFNNSNSLEFLSHCLSANYNDKEFKNNRYIGPLSVEYFYHVSPVVGVGIIGVFNNHKESVKRNGAVVAEQNFLYLTFMPAFKFNWLRRDNWGLYSKIGAGYTQYHLKYTEKVPDKSQTTSNYSSFNFHVSVIGAEVDSDKVRGFAELGFGEQGLALAGLRLRF